MGERLRRRLRPGVILVDAGPLCAAVAARDRNHRRCAELLVREVRRLTIPALVLTDVA